MSALYIMRLSGQSGMKAGALYVGKNIVVGVDVGGIKYDGTYQVADGRIIAKAKMFVPAGVQLVTGQLVQQATQIDITADWPVDFANGQPQQIAVQGQSVAVTFEKIRDIP